LPEVSVRLPPLDELAERWQAIAPLLAKSTRRAGGAYEPVDVLRAQKPLEISFQVKDARSPVH